MDWVSVQVPAALITGAVSLVVSLLTAAVTLRVAQKRAETDKELTELKGKIEDGIAKRREALELRLQNLRSELDREKLSAEQRQANRRPFLQKQLEVCFEAVDVAARLASETDLTEWKIARTKFWRLYWGILSIVEDRPVEQAMISIKNSIPKMQVTESDLPITALQEGAYNLAHAARDLMGESWEINLPKLEAI